LETSLFACYQVLAVTDDDAPAYRVGFVIAESCFTVSLVLQSPDEQPLHPQFTHWMSWLSVSCFFGTRQMQVDRKFVSLV
jgi:hypothetical protein